MSGSAVPDEITVVSGLPLSGTSMMMKMLGVGGLELVTDNLRAPDQGNSQGYFEFQDVRRLMAGGDKSWLRHARGKAIKVISQFVPHLPGEHDYSVVFMRCDRRVPGAWFR